MTSPWKDTSAKFFQLNPYSPYFYKKQKITSKFWDGLRIIFIDYLGCPVIYVGIEGNEKSDELVRSVLLSCLRSFSYFEREEGEQTKKLILLTL